MGAGAAKRVKDRFPEAPVALGNSIARIQLTGILCQKKLDDSDYEPSDNAIRELIHAGVQEDYHTMGYLHCPEQMECTHEHCLSVHHQIVAVQTKRDWKAPGDWDLTVASLKMFSARLNKENIRFVLNCPLIGLGGFGDERKRVFDMVEEILGQNDVIVCTLD